MKNKNRQLISYLFFGGLTTLLNILIYALLARVIMIDYRAATTAAWIISVIFAFFTNKNYVFNSKRHHFLEVTGEFFSFVFFRALSYVLDIATMIFFIEIIGLDDLITKVMANILVIIFNYFASKFFVFRQRSWEGES